jgi:Holliday junction resolvasome RuvABC endonuclease subunit
MAIALGLDLSAASTGLVALQDRYAEQQPPRVLCERVVPTGKARGMERCSMIAEAVLKALEIYQPDEVVIEDYAVGKFAGSAIVSIEVGAVIRYFMRQLDRKVIRPSATQVKKFAAGTSNGIKKEHMMMWVLKRWEHTSLNNDTADGFVLGCIGLARRGKLHGATAFQKEIVGALQSILP